MEKQLSMLKDCFVCVKRKMTYTVSATRGYCVSDTRVVDDFLEDYASTMTECNELMYPKPEVLAPGDTASLLKCFACVRRKLTYGLSSSRGYCISSMRIADELGNFNATADKMTGCHSLPYPTIMTELPPLMDTTQRVAVTSGYVNISSWTSDTIHTTIATIGSKLEAAMESSSRKFLSTSLGTFIDETSENIYANVTQVVNTSTPLYVATSIGADEWEVSTSDSNISQEFKTEVMRGVYTSLAADLFGETTTTLKSLSGNVSEEFDNDVQEMRTEMDVVEQLGNQTLSSFTESGDVVNSTELIPTEEVQTADSGTILWSLLAFALGALLTLLAFKVIRMTKRRGRMNFPSIPTFRRSRMNFPTFPRLNSRWVWGSRDVEMQEMNNNNTDV